MLTGPQWLEMQEELVRTERFGTMPEQPLVFSNANVVSCRHSQFTVGGPWSTRVTVWLQELVLPQRSVKSQVRVMTRGQRLVVVLAMVTVTFVPLQASKAVGGSNVQGEPH